jgi:dipeptidyl aminopeptidase/acylaminoacyl peptidase
LKSAPFGSWSSPITAASIVEGAATITEVVVDGDDVWWAEARPSEGGRVAVLRRRPDGTIDEITPSDANVRTRVHEYGGGAWWARDGVLVYSELVDQQLRRIDSSTAPTSTSAPASPRTLTAKVGARFADGRITPDGRWYVCVRELHHGAAHGPGAREPDNEIVAVAMDGSGETRVLVDGADFVACPRPSPDGRQLAWIQWNHPDMPWDGTELWVAELGDGRLTGGRRLAGGREESLLQPEWSPSGRLHVVTDRSGWWNVHAVDLGNGSLRAVRAGSFDVGGPMWAFGSSSYAFVTDPAGAEHVVIDRDVADVASDATCLRGRGDRVVVAGASWQHETQVVERGADGSTTVLRAARDLALDPGLVPPPESITFPTPGADGPEIAHALFYRPANPAFEGLPGERPPLLVLAHGGPTGAARRSLHLPVRFWTSRGFAVVDVNYGGSTGYGRGYREQLYGQWGVVDVADCLAAAGWLADRGRVDRDRLCIRGGSAGGFTTLAALARPDTAFAAGADHYGVADLTALAADTHKF